MKYLLVLVVVMVGFWVWRSNRAGERVESQKKRRPPAPGALDMIGCDRCGVHFPSEDLIRGKKGVYCCAQHRDQAEA